MTLHKPAAPKPRPGFPARIDASAYVAPVGRVDVSGSSQRLTPKPSAGAQLTARGLGMDSHAVRLSMVNKLKQQGISDPMVLQAMSEVERHRFVDTALVNQAYEDTSLPIGLGQTISKPGVVARMLELLRQGQSGRLGRVMEIGTGCGYQAAVLSRLCSEVYSIERLRGLHEKARDNLRPFRLANLHLILGDGMVGYAKGAPFAGIIAAAGGEALPQAWIDQLAVGGRVVAPVSAGAISPAGQALVVLEKTPHGLRQTAMEAVHFVPLKSGVER